MKEDKCPPCLQEGQERRSGKLQTGQPLLTVWEGDGENPPGNNVQTHEGPEGDQEKSDWIYEGDIMLNQPHSFLQ